MPEVTAAAVIEVFDQCFAASEHTRLVGGAAEPFYQPAVGQRLAEIQFRADYVRSALHEVAHWCHAGRARRRLPDYGYWYTPDDRNADQQAAFFAVEARPQAIEKLFCQALGIGFRASVDNLNLQISEQDLAAFDQRLEQARLDYLSAGVPSRAARFIAALSKLRPRCTGPAESAV